MNGAHVCCSGTLECSGINPCDACMGVVNMHILAPAMKAAGLDGRNDPRLIAFFQTYNRQRDLVLAEVIRSAQQLPLPMVAPPTIPPMADVPLTEAELEGMARQAPVTAVATGTESTQRFVDPSPPVDTFAETVRAPEAVALPDPTPPGLLSDEEFRTRFPTFAPETVMDMPAPLPQPAPVTVPVAVQAPAEVPLPRKSEPSLLRLASQAITPTLPTATKESETNEAGSAPAPAPPSPTSQPKAFTDDVSAVPASANPSAENTKDAEATSHG